MNISNIKSKNSFQKLCSAFEKTGSSLSQGPAQDINKADPQGFAEALANDAFKKRHMEMEPILAPSGVILAYECLSRPRTKDGVEYSISDLTELAYNMGLAKEMDTLLISNALKKAYETQHTPITLNSSIEAAMDPKFWDDIIPRMERTGLNNIIIELLEHDIAPNADISHLQQLRDQGLRFALDDLSVGQSHENRLSAFGGLIDYIKFDGPLVRAHLDGAHHDKDGTFLSARALKDMIQHLQTELPNTMLIAEYVTNTKEANELSRIGVHYVQGRELNENTFAINSKISNSDIESSMSLGA